MGKLKDELLTVYRQLAHSHSERERLSYLLSSANSKRKRAEEAYENERRIHEADRKGWHETFNQLEQENILLTFQVVEHERAFSSVLDLVGAVVEDEAFLDQFAVDTSTWKMGESNPPTLQEVQQQIVDAGGVRTMPTADDGNGGIMPLLCLSCNADKSGFYLCEECFDLNLDHDCALFEELQDAWDEGHRNFPRPGRNAKELYKK
jgi:hypothetical protein